MKHDAFDVVVNRHLDGRSERSVLLAAGLPAKALENVRRAKGLPTPARIEQLAQALDAPAPLLTRALLRDAGYQVDAGGLEADVADTVQSLPTEGQALLLELARAVRQFSRRPQA